MAFHYSPKIVTDGLVFYIDAFNNKSYIGSGTIANDLTANNNNSDLINGVGFDGESFVFDGVNDYISSPYSVLGITQLTYSIWVNFNTIPTGTIQYFLGGTWGGADAVRVISFRYVGGNVIRMTTRLNSTPISSNISISTLLPNNWYNFTYIYNGGSGSFYLDGEFIDNFSGLNSQVSSTSTSNFTVGQDNTGFGIFGGDVSTIKIYDKVLQSQEVLQNYNALKYRYI